MSDQALLRIDDLTKRFGASTILGGVSLAIAEGEAFALLGPSGSGKSTLLRCVMGLVPFDEGRVAIADATLTSSTSPAESRRRASAVRRHVGMIFQDFQLFGHLNAEDNVAEAPRSVLGLSAKEARERARALLDRVGISARASAYPRELSGGQKQRVAIARALAMEPKVLLCDEATSALDPESKRDVLDTLASLQAEGLALVMVTHELAVARRACSRAAFLLGGELVSMGPLPDVIDRADDPRVTSFLARATL